MSLPVFWRESLAAGAPGGAADPSGPLLLDGLEGHHAAAVRRLAVGERVRVTDGRGAYVEGPVVTVRRRSVEVRVEQRVDVPAPDLRVSVVQALPKRGRAELAVQALVEVGVDRIVPWASERSQVRVGGERGERVLSKWRAWAFEAGKQARRSWFCEVGAVASTAEVGALAATADAALVLHEDAAEPLAGMELPVAGEVLLVVGPEGGIGAAELAALGVGAGGPAFRGGDPAPLGGDSARGGTPSPGPSSGGTPSPGPSSGGDPSKTPRETPGLPALGAVRRSPGAGGVRAVRMGDTVMRTSTAGAVAAGVVLSRTRWR